MHATRAAQFPFITPVVVARLRRIRRPFLRRSKTRNIFVEALFPEMFPRCANEETFAEEATRF